MNFFIVWTEFRTWTFWVWTWVFELKLVQKLNLKELNLNKFVQLWSILNLEFWILQQFQGHRRLRSSLNTSYFTCKRVQWNIFQFLHVYVAFIFFRAIKLVQESMSAPEIIAERNLVQGEKLLAVTCRGPCRMQLLHNAGQSKTAKETKTK